MERKIKNKVTGYRTQDGAGVSLVRVLSNQTTDLFDPFLMLDSFDSEDPQDYIKGFPMHPHRGIETITYLSQGSMTHRDSLGNEDTINAQEVQWMCAGSGIMHEEMPQPAERMLGVQIWLNLPQSAKMSHPTYTSLRKDDIEAIPIEGGTLYLISGSYRDAQGFKSDHLPLNFYDIHLEANQSITLDTDSDDSVMVFLLEGDAVVANQKAKEKSAVKLTAGDSVTLESQTSPIEILFLSSKRLDEPIAWGGPIVMNHQAELDLAFSELQVGTFIKEKPTEEQ